ncbi:MAG: hypothetical protein JOZ12_15250 [Sinobacteraceae bacterium]|nr:hypothetical protein [Nevskiaceae bacterium]
MRLFNPPRARGCLSARYRARGDEAHHARGGCARRRAWHPTCAPEHPSGRWPLTFAYPKWIPGEHAADGPITQVVSLVIKAGDRVLPWRRDPLDTFQFRVAGAPGRFCARRAVRLPLAAQGVFGRLRAHAQHNSPPPSCAPESSGALSTTGVCPVRDEQNQICENGWRWFVSLGAR